MDFTKLLYQTPIESLGSYAQNEIYIKRDDLLPFSYGGNKFRKAALFFEEIQRGKYDVVLTYGSANSNHCRIVANMAATLGLSCELISTEEGFHSLSRVLCKQFGAKVHVMPVSKVSSGIEKRMSSLREEGYHPYFIPGGGHGNTGTKAYDLAYDEIKDFEYKNSLTFDYIFLPSGTGTTQAGLVCGKRRWCDDFRKIVGISIARKNPYGKQVVEESIAQYTGSSENHDIIFTDKYICDGYGTYNIDIERTIDAVMCKHGIPLDPTYTGKAFAGMIKYIETQGLQNKRILFIHTGGTPIYQDWMLKR